MYEMKSMIKTSKGCLGEEELAEVREAFAYGYFGHASKVTEFEEKLGAYLGAKNVVATNTGTSALHLALEALGIGPGDEVIVPSLTFVASFQAISAAGARPVPCEIDPSTLLMDRNDVLRKITTKTKAVMPVHYAGNPCAMDELLRLKSERNIRIIEDAAHAFGSVYHGKKIGSFGDIACFSFDSIKNITCGEGGAVVCSEDSVASILREKRLLGINRKDGIFEGKRWLYEVKTQGFRYHMSNINAAIGLAQLKKAEGFIARRREICRHYDTAFRNLSGLRSLPIDYGQVAPHIYVVRVAAGARDALMDFLLSKDIETTIHYIPNHLQPFYREQGTTLPVTEEAYGEIVSLPLHCGLSDADVETVVGSVHEFFEKRGAL